ncbi:energy-coupling factor ABC transporter substrate-binding protein [Cyanobium sp. N5-Cardenillas]|jgi:cobalt/nickel transport protein|uniref:energy-coupling factor ABC transporter substrate-binding protein n=1 Tax=Cyanobium sp. N5-Cardenillas TaxID=2823720 RepID=UPI0020CE194D|nr:energy-coupling factor ABC transporter substrate-binding protein [Cyanobium sp. N5-Cardenillas]MCP9785646.1 energy-coupling factor ABC transporter substrate-binding protein [Cyanobium sp. N5-Cardenillas]
MPTPSERNPRRHNWLLVAGVVALALFPVLFIRGEYGGADGQGTEAIEKLQPSYKPWFEPVVELPSGEIESLMFATQAALGAGVVGFVIGLYRGRTLAEERKEPPAP